MKSNVSIPVSRNEYISSSPMSTFVSKVCLPLFRSNAFIRSTFILKLHLVTCRLKCKFIECINSNLKHALLKQFSAVTAYIINSQWHISDLVICLNHIRSNVCISPSCKHTSVKERYLPLFKSEACFSSYLRLVIPIAACLNQNKSIVYTTCSLIDA